MKQFIYDSFMSFGPVIVVGLLTILGIKMTHFHNEKMEFNRKFKYRKIILEEAHTIVMAIYHTIDGMKPESEDMLNKTLNGAYATVKPRVEEVIKTEVNVNKIRKIFSDIEVNANTIRLNFKVDNYLEKQTENFAAIAKEIERLINDLDAEYSRYNNRKQVS